MQIACRGEMAMEVDEVENGGLLAESSGDRLLGASPLITEPLAAASPGVSSSHSFPKMPLAEY